MNETSSHCPYLGLKQNRAIRFASPTPEHRCYVNGDPTAIPVDQASYCLASGHTQCPLYMGLTVSTIDSAARTAAVPPPTGISGWFRSLSARDRTIYLTMIGLLSLIMLAYIVIGVQAISTNIAQIPSPTLLITATSAVVGVQETSTPVLPTPTDGILATPTDLPTSIPSPTPTIPPTREPVIIFPTTPPTDMPLPTLTPVPPTVVLPTPIPATRVLPTPIPATRVPPTGVPPTPIPPTPIPATAVPVNNLPPTPEPVQLDISTQRLWLYFGDTTGQLFVPVQRNATVVNKQVANTAIAELIAGPRNGLTRLIPENVQLLGTKIENGTAFVNLDRRPSYPEDDRGIQALALTLTHFPGISRVQVQVNGVNLGAAMARPVVNPLNPFGLANNVRQTEFLPIYFLSADGYHYVRLIRLINKTDYTATETIYALLDGPGSYGFAVQRTIPEGTELRDLTVDRNAGVVTISVSSRFAEAGNRIAAAQTIVQSLTTLPGIQGVQILVDGAPLGDYWGSEFSGILRRPLINPE